MGQLSLSRQSWLLAKRVPAFNVMDPLIWQQPPIPRQSSPISKNFTGRYLHTEYKLIVEKDVRYEA